MNEYLPLATLRRLLGVLLLVMLPHFLRLPAWETALVLGLGLWRVCAGMRQWRMPPNALRAALTLAAAAGVYLSYGRVSGQNAGVALLVVMVALKLTELKARRDVMVLVFLMYFLMVTHFLYSQALWTIVYLLVCTVAITAVLVEASHPGSALPPRLTLRYGGRLVLHALPLMLLLFVLFPRIPGPLWGLPPDAGAARSGLSDSMSPGDISKLVLSDEIAFRVTFEGAPPPEDRLYWRGPVFWHFDGRAWHPGFRGTREMETAPAELLGGHYRYQLMLEPMRQPWLLALDLVDGSSLPPRSRLNVDRTLVADAPVRNRLSYTLHSATEHRLQAQALPDWLRDRTTRLPAAGNARSVALGRQWRLAAAGDEAVVQRALREFGERDFVYTLEPAPLGRESIDEFLFETREGYCEHYASAFTVLMRAAGIPARVVTGYLGGERNPFGGYYVVRQSDAHAWSEVWLQGRGWVRVDPTRAIPPSRVRDGAAATRAAREGRDAYLAGRMSWTSIRYALEARWEWVNAQWNGLVLGYGTELQQQLLSRIGLHDWRRMILALTAGLVGALTVIGLAIMRRSRPAPVRERSLRLWQQMLRRLQRRGFEPAAGEGQRDFVRRVSRAQPALAPALSGALAAYLALRYEQAQQQAALEKRLEDAVRALHRHSAWRSPA